MILGRKYAKGYAFKKAIQIMEYRKGHTKIEPSLPASRSMRGAIKTWTRKLSKGHNPVGKQEKKVYEREIKRSGLERKERPGFTLDDKCYSGKKYDTIPLTIINIFKDKGPIYLGFISRKQQQDFDDIIELADSQIGNEKTEFNYNWWTKKLKNYGLVFYPLYYYQ